MWDKNNKIPPSTDDFTREDVFKIILSLIFWKYYYFIGIIETKGKIVEK